MCIEKQPILSILISTYNRADRLIKNLQYMLKAECKDVEFIVGDNCSVDDTWKRLHEITDNRLKIYRNDENKGFINRYLIAKNMNGRWFMHLNDRDHIKPNDIISLCNILRTINGCDILVTERPNVLRLEEGYYDWDLAMWCIFKAIHPGLIVWNSRFIKENNWNAILEYQSVLFSKDVKRAYVWNHYIINQPADRDRIEKTRQETFSEPYFAPEAAYKAVLLQTKQASDLYFEKERFENLIYCVYRAGLERTTEEYAASIVLPNFAKRYNYEGHTDKEWLKNGITLYKKIMKSALAKGRRKMFTKVTLKSLINYYKVYRQRTYIPRVCGRKKYAKQKECTNKYQRLFVMTNKWLHLKNAGMQIADYLSMKDIFKVAVYGMGYVGENLIEELQDSDVQVAYGIDRRIENKFGNIKIFTPNEQLEKVDAVIVTAVFCFDEIKKDIEKQLECPIVSLEDIITEMETSCFL